jgi:hypothetical protein
MFWSNKTFGGATEAAKDAAEHCCEPRSCECGNSTLTNSHILCAACIHKAEETKERLARDKATKIRAFEYELPMVYHEGHGNDGYLTVDEARDAIFEGEMEPWAWACTPMRLALDGREIVQTELESQLFFDGAYDAIGEGAMVELQAFLDDWCARLTMIGYEQDTSTIVEFPMI